MITIRKATSSDIPSIRSMADVASRHTYCEILSSQQMEYMMERMYSEMSLREQIEVQGHQFFILSAEGKNVGYASFNKEKDDDTYFTCRKSISCPNIRTRVLVRYC